MVVSSNWACRVVRVHGRYESGCAGVRFIRETWSPCFQFKRRIPSGLRPMALVRKTTVFRTTSRFWVIAPFAAVLLWLVSAGPRPAVPSGGESARGCMVAARLPGVPTVARGLINAELCAGRLGERKRHGRRSQRHPAAELADSQDADAISSVGFVACDQSLLIQLFDSNSRLKGFSRPLFPLTGLKPRLVRKLPPPSDEPLSL